MQNLHIDYHGSDLTFAKASLLAKTAAMQHSMQNPAIMAWHQHSNQAMSPSYAGADPGSWWEKYGAGNGGRIEVSVSDEFDFVLMDTEGYETVDQLPIRNLVAKDGKEYICLAPMLADGQVPVEKACMPLEEWAANQY